MQFHCVFRYVVPTKKIHNKNAIPLCIKIKENYISIKFERKKKCLDIV